MGKIEEYRALTPSKARKMTREELIAWLEWNDPNGCYSDEECKIEGFRPLTRDEALKFVLDQIAEDIWITPEDRTKKHYFINYEFTDTDGLIYTRMVNISAGTKSEAKKIFVDAVMAGNEDLWGETWGIAPEHAGGNEYYWEGPPERAGGLAPRPEKYIVFTSVEKVPPVEKPRDNPDAASAKRRAMRG